MHKSYKKWLDDGCPKLYCECLCHGEIIIKNYCKNHGIPKYIRGHQPIWNKGKINCFSIEVIKKKSERWLGDKNPNYGKPVSEERKRKQSDAMKGRHSGDKNPAKNPEVGMKISKNNCMHRLEVRMKVSGENSYNWKGGISFKPYCYRFNKELKDQIRKRDNYQCQYPDCLCSQLESLILYGGILMPHHIHYDKENCYPDLITLCVKHNSMSNFNRDYWEEFYMKLLKKRNLLNYFGDMI